MTLSARSMGEALTRVDGIAKVRGEATYAFEQHVDNPAYLYPLTSTVARGRVVDIDASKAEQLDGVLFVVTHLNAPRLASTEDGEYTILQSNGVAFRGQFIGAVVAESSEIARHAAELVSIEYDVHGHDTELRADRDDLYEPGTVNPGQDTTTEDGGVEAALASAAVTIDHTYSTPMEHNNPMEPHDSIAVWEDGRLTLYDSTRARIRCAARWRRSSAWSPTRCGWSRRTSEAGSAPRGCRTRTTCWSRWPHSSCPAGPSSSH